MNRDEELTLNQVAQGIFPAQAGEDWFTGLPEVRRTAVLRGLAHMAIQAGARPEDARAAIQQSGLKPTFTPCVLLMRDQMAVQLAKIANLPASEFLKAYQLLMALFQIADARRRATQCAAGCSHWWHHDLTSGGQIDELSTAGATP